MGAELTPGDPREFEVTELSKREQVVGDDGYAIWVWSVKGLEAGKRKLYLHVWARIEVPSVPPDQQDVGLYDKELDVQVNYLWQGTQMFKSNTAAVLTGGSSIIGAISAVVWKFRSRGRRALRAIKRKILTGVTALAKRVGSILPGHRRAKSPPKHEA